jgi:hypothetical protein
LSFIVTPGQKELRSVDDHYRERKSKLARFGEIEAHLREVIECVVNFVVAWFRFAVVLCLNELRTLAESLSFRDGLVSPLHQTETAAANRKRIRMHLPERRTYRSYKMLVDEAPAFAGE